MKPRHKRMMLIGGGVAARALSATRVRAAFQKNLVGVFSPSQVANKEAPQNRTFRIGGLVEAGSVKREADGLTTTFVVTDTANRIAVSYKGALPDLFKEGKGVVTQGKLDAGGLFVASEVLAKHDENYMPPEAAHAVDQAQKAQKSVVQN